MYAAIILDAYIVTKEVTVSFLQYPLIVVKDFFIGIRQLVSISPSSLKRVAKYEKMSKDAVIFFTCAYLFIMILMTGLILFANNIPGCQLAKEMLT
jgi:hypothetical protein